MVPVTFPFSSLSFSLFAVGLCIALFFLKSVNYGSSRAAYIAISAPGALIYAVMLGYELYFARAFSNPFELMGLIVYAIINPGPRIFPTVMICNVFASPRPPEFSTWVCCGMLAGLWLWGQAFTSSLLPKLIDGFS
jgi:hypothetical protein